MRHLATLSLLVLLTALACGPKPQEPFPSASQGSPSPVIPAAPPQSPAPEALSPEADRTARAALTRLWSNQAQAFHSEFLLESRQKDTRAEEIQSALIENLTLPLGPLEKIQQVSRGDFESPEDLHTIGITPSPATSQMEKDQFGQKLQESWWRVHTSRGQQILAYVALAPQGEELRVQTLILRSSRLGSLMTRQDEKDRKQVARILELVQAGQGEALYNQIASPGLKANLTPSAVKLGAQQLREALPEGKVEPQLQEGWRWFSSEGWTRSYRYSMAGRKGALEMQINLNEDDRLLSGLTWNLAGSQRGGEF